MFTVISYLRSGCNTVMGCLMESWDSDLDVREFETREGAAEFIAEEEAAQAKNRKYGEPPCKEYLVINGSVITYDFMSAKGALDILLEESVI